MDKVCEFLTVVEHQTQFDFFSQRNKFSEIFHRIRQNINRTKIEAMCRWPNKKAIAMPQSALKMFSPQKYVIHRCSDDTACCGSSDKTCVAKKIEEIVLWFHVRNAVSYILKLFPQESRSSDNGARKLKSINCSGPLFILNSFKF